MTTLKAIDLRAPRLEDGFSIHRLIEACPPLDPNSSYCNLLQCSHFSDTSVIAIFDGKPVGFVSGYVIPNTNTLFIWQVAVAESVRGMGLALRMLLHILSRPYCRKIDHIHTTITENNRASRALFERLANTLSSKLSVADWMDSEVHFEGRHDSEPLISIGPFDPLTILTEKYNENF